MSKIMAVTLILAALWIGYRIGHEIGYNECKIAKEAKQ